jgi:DNA polymerase-3 subunit epsilon
MDRDTFGLLRRLKANQDDTMEMSLKLHRPLAVLDLETTGLKTDLDRIVEIAIVKVDPDGKTTQYVRKINPQIPIPPEATAVHGIRDEHVKNEPAFKAVAQDIFNFLQGCDLAGFNLSSYDLRMLQREFERAGVKFSTDGRAIVDAKQIYHTKEPRDLEAASRYYLNEEHTSAHSALDDVLVTWRVINAQVRRYQDLPRDPAGINAMFNKSVDSEGKFEWNGQQAAFAFGKYRGRLLQQVAETDAEYLTWIADKGEFRQDVKEIARKALEGVFPKRTKA